MSLSHTVSEIFSIKQ